MTYMLLLLSFAFAQAPTTDVTVTGCVQRAPANLEKGKPFVLMNASNSPMGGDVGTTGTQGDTAAQPNKDASPVESRRYVRETGGVTYLLEGKTNFEEHAGQRVEIKGTIGDRVKASSAKPTMAQPVPRLNVKELRVVGPHC